MTRVRFSSSSCSYFQISAPEDELNKIDLMEAVAGLKRSVIGDRFRTAVRKVTHVENKCESTELTVMLAIVLSYLQLLVLKRLFRPDTKSGTITLSSSIGRSQSLPVVNKLPSISQRAEV
jgi:hypothetical protein